MLQYLTREEIYSNAILLTLGGSETTSNTLSGLAYMIATNPGVKAKITDELRATFIREDEIDMRSTAKLPYLSAVIEEVLRYFPPGPNAMPRITPPEGNSILGDWVPGNVSRTIFRIRYDEADHLTVRPSWASHTGSCIAVNVTSSARRNSFQNAG